MRKVQRQLPIGDDLLIAGKAQRRGLGFGACALASSLWGCGFFFGKIALAEMNVGAMVFYRFLFAMVALLPLLLTHKPGLNRREWGVLLLASFLGVPLQFLDPVLWAVADDGVARVVDGGDDAGDPGRGRGHLGA